MALPKLETPTYIMNVPSTGEEIKYRPFLVKEEKILLLAMQETDSSATHHAVLSLVEACTFGSVGKNNDPMFDIEYTFIKIRQKSISETVEVKLLCPDDGETYVDAVINLDDVMITMEDNHSTTCNLGKDAKGNEVVMDLSYPSVDSTLKASNLDNSVEQIFYIIKSCVKSIQFGDDIYNSVDITPKELDEFIDNLTQEQFKTLQEFFDTMPKLTHDIEVKNPKTGVTSNVHMEGLSDFLS